MVRYLRGHAIGATTAAVALLTLAVAVFATNPVVRNGCTAPRVGIDYSAHPPAGLQPANPATSHDPNAYLYDGQIVYSTEGAISSIWGYVHNGEHNQASADSIIYEVQFWLLDDLNGNKVSDEANRTPWRMVWSWRPGGTHHAKGWGLPTLVDGTATAWEGQDVLQGRITGLVPGHAYFLLIRALCKQGMTSTMPTSADGHVTGPEEFYTDSTDIDPNGNGSAIKDWHVVWFRVNKTPPPVTPK